VRFCFIGRTIRALFYRLGLMAIVGLLSALALVFLALRFPGLDAHNLLAEIRSIRELAAGDDPDDLADLLDHSLACIPAGVFVMGSDRGPPNERPQRSVFLDAFAIDRYEVTNAQYRRFLIATKRVAPVYWQGRNYPAGQADLPVAGVGWPEARDYCAWAGKRLPTEAEWEKACRGPDGWIFPWGEDWDPARGSTGLFQAECWPPDLEQGWELLQAAGLDPALPAPQPVGSFPGGASPYGVFDLAGSVSEWVVDWYNWDGYAEWPLENPVGLGPPWDHSLRGSGWFDRYGQEGQVEQASRCSQRNASHSADDPRLGFRCALSLNCNRSLP
jgi:formylglycine-generating enzyme required for sulfatase activity